MKILYITKFFPPEYGGIETLSKNLCDFFYKKNNNVEVVCFSKKKTFVSKKHLYRVNYFKPFLTIFSTPVSLKIIIFLMKNFRKFDVIHLHTPNPLIELILIFLPIKNLIISWGSDIINQKILKFLFRPFQLLLLKKSKKIICLSRNYLNYSKDLKIFKHKTFIVPPLTKNNFINITYNSKIKKINLVMVGRLVDYKGHDIAIRSMKFLPHNYSLSIIGNGPNKKKLLNLILNLDLKKRIKLLDRIDNKLKIKILKKSSIFLMSSTSRAESFGIAILEAISLGLPLIISKVQGSGMNDMIIDNFNGYRYKNFSSFECAKKIMSATKSSSKLKKFSKNSFKLFNKKFNIEIIEKKLNKIYN